MFDSEFEEGLSGVNCSQLCVGCVYDEYETCRALGHQGCIDQINQTNCSYGK